MLSSSHGWPIINVCTILIFTPLALCSFGFPLEFVSCSPLLLPPSCGTIYFQARHFNFSKKSLEPVVYICCRACDEELVLIVNAPHSIQSQDTPLNIYSWHPLMLSEWELWFFAKLHDILSSCDTYWDCKLQRKNVRKSKLTLALQTL